MGQADAGRRLFLIFAIRKRRICVISAGDIVRRKGGRTMRNSKLRPTFKSDAQEAAFWASHDSTAYIDYSKSRRTIFPRLKPLAETVSLRLPKSLLDQLKMLTNKHDVPYQKLLKRFVLERVILSCPYDALAVLRCSSVCTRSSTKRFRSF